MDQVQSNMRKPDNLTEINFEYTIPLKEEIEKNFTFL